MRTIVHQNDGTIEYDFGEHGPTMYEVSTPKYAGVDIVITGLVVLEDDPEVIDDVYTSYYIDDVKVTDPGVIAYLDGATENTLSWFAYDTAVELAEEED